MHAAQLAIGKQLERDHELQLLCECVAWGGERALRLEEAIFFSWDHKAKLSRRHSINVASQRRTKREDMVLVTKPSADDAFAFGTIPKKLYRNISTR